MSWARSQNGVEGPVVEVAPAGMPEQHRSRQLELLDRALKLVRALLRVLRRRCGERCGPVRPRPHHLGEVVVGLPGYPPGGLRLEEPLDRGDIRQHGQVDPTLIHQFQLARGVGEAGKDPLHEVLRIIGTSVRRRSR
jgi:hypothetical protein